MYVEAHQLGQVEAAMIELQVALQQICFQLR